MCLQEAFPLPLQGFGDFVPENEDFYPLTILFIVLGLIITTMCVDLVAVQYVNKVNDQRRLSECLLRFSDSLLRPRTGRCS